MKTCATCKKRETCTKLCPEVESLLPKEETGRDSRRELQMDPEHVEAAAELYSCREWRIQEAAREIKLDLSALTPKEKKAVMLLATGMSQREAARRLKINLSALQKRVHSARRRLSGGQDARTARS